MHAQENLTENQQHNVDISPLQKSLDELALKLACLHGWRRDKQLARLEDNVADIVFDYLYERGLI